MNAEQLLEKVKEIRSKYEDECRSKASDFNVFKILGASGYELPMRDFLYEILRLEGPNETGRIYLKKFFIDVLDIHDIDNDELKDICVEREYSKPVFSEQRNIARIDLVIKSSYRFIPIEVKIGTDEGPEQCFDYFCVGKREMEVKEITKKWGLFFLTRDGHEPESTEKLNNEERSLVQSVSWKKHIVSWLRGMLNQENRENVAEFIRQYIEIIESNTMKEELIKMMRENGIQWDNRETVDALQSLNESFKNAKIDSLRKLFLEIREALSKNNIDNESDVEKFYGHKQTYPGIGCKVKDEDSDNGDVLSIRFEIGDSPYIGFQVQSGDKVGDKEWAKSCIKEDKRPKLINDNQYGWIYYTYIKPADWSQTTFSLRNDDYACCFLCNEINRKKFVDEIIEKFKELNGWLVGKE